MAELNDFPLNVFCRGYVWKQAGFPYSLKKPNRENLEINIFQGKIAEHSRRLYFK